MMSEREVFITGAGTVSALGRGVGAAAGALRSCRSGISLPDVFRTEHGELPVGEVKIDNADLRGLLAKHLPVPRVATRAALLGMLALDEALANAGLSPDAGKGGLWRRSWNAADVDAYIAAASSGDWNGIRESESLTREQYREEEIMLGLRTDRGVPVSLLAGNPDSAENTEKLLRAGALVPVGGVFSDKGGSGQEPRLRIPEDRFFVSDDIIAGLL